MQTLGPHHLAVLIWEVSGGMARPLYLKYTPMGSRPRQFLDHTLRNIILGFKEFSKTSYPRNKWRHLMLSACLLLV